MSKKITLLDPSLKNNTGENSDNLGDIVIFQSVLKEIMSLFPNDEIIRISTHSFMGKKEYDILKKSDFVILGGTNILSSDIRYYNQWQLSEKRFYYLFPKVKDVICLGVGWWQYQQLPNFFTKLFYRHVLSGKMSHSVRDNYTKKMLSNVGIKAVVNTSCPTTWDLQGLNPNRQNLKNASCLFTLTDYNKNKELDNRLIDVLLKYYTEKLVFFPQGKSDKEYLITLKSYKENKSRIEILERSIETFSSIMSSDMDYIGTRLHGGVKCLQNSMDALIVSVDNRATEISKDINLPVVERSDIDSVISWIEGKEIFKTIELPNKNIAQWKSQFKY